eukprot:112677-Chlamydomonas_euryale.AAC.1
MAGGGGSSHVAQLPSRCSGAILSVLVWLVGSDAAATVMQVLGVGPGWEQRVQGPCSRAGWRPSAPSARCAEIVTAYNLFAEAQRATTTFWTIGSDHRRRFPPPLPTVAPLRLFAAPLSSALRPVYVCVCVWYYNSGRLSLR